jgi:hypothetical protein
LLRRRIRRETVRQRREACTIWDMEVAVLDMEEVCLWEVILISVLGVTHSTVVVSEECLPTMRVK